MHAPNPPYSALLVHAGALGDFIFALRIVAALRGGGATSVTVLGRPEIAALGRLGGGVDRILDFQGGSFHALYEPDEPLPPRVTEALRGHALCVHMVPDEAGVSARRLQEATGGRIIAIDPRPRPDATGHITDQWLGDLRSAGLEVAVPPPPRLVISDSARRRAESTWLHDARPPRVVIHPGSGAREKTWPASAFLELAQHLRRDECSVWVLVGPVEEERGGADTLAILSHMGPLIRNLPLADAAALLAASDVYAGNDAGPSHLAAAVNTPTVAVFGSTSPRLWRPLGEHVRIVGGDGWPRVEDVYAAVRESLATNRRF